MDVDECNSQVSGSVFPAGFRCEQVYSQVVATERSKLTDRRSHSVNSMYDLGSRVDGEILGVLGEEEHWGCEDTVKKNIHVGTTDVKLK